MDNVINELQDILCYLKPFHTHGWQPIETMPDEYKDGRWVCLCGGYVYKYGWDKGKEEPPFVVAQFNSDITCFDFRKTWQFCWYDGGIYGRYHNPTHWMPLPKLPTKENDDE